MPNPGANSQRPVESVGYSCRYYTERDAVNGLVQAPPLVSGQGTNRVGADHRDEVKINDALQQSFRSVCGRINLTIFNE
jgi:hypothetical protein